MSTSPPSSVLQKHLLHRTRRRDPLQILSFRQVWLRSNPGRRPAEVLRHHQLYLPTALTRDPLDSLHLPTPFRHPPSPLPPHFLRPASADLLDQLALPKDRVPVQSPGVHRIGTRVAHPTRRCRQARVHRRMTSTRCAESPSRRTRSRRHTRPSFDSGEARRRSTTSEAKLLNKASRIAGARTRRNSESSSLMGTRSERTVSQRLLRRTIARGGQGWSSAMMTEPTC